MTQTEPNFSHRVCEIVAQIPSGRVMTYGQLAALAGVFPGGRSEQGRRLEAEGIAVSPDYVVNIEELIWYPDR